MALTRLQKLQMQAEQLIINERTTRVANEFNLGRSYAKRLEKPDSYIAALALYSQIWENIIRCALQLYKSRRTLLDIRGEKDRFVRIDLNRLENRTLGDYINKLTEFDFQNKHGLILTLREFNRMRNEAVHHAFDGKATDVVTYENKIKEYLDSDAFQRTEKGLSNLFNEISAEMQEIKKDD